jgi:nucleoside-diphosphate-sugar epimerase
MTERKSILLTGASGFIGRRLGVRLSQEGWDVTALGRQAAPANRPGMEMLVSASTSRADLAETVGNRRFDAVIHLAAAGVAPGERDAGVLFEANVAYPANLLKALEAMPPKAFVMLGSCAEYAHCEPVSGGLDEDAPVETWRLYGATKAAGTLAASATAKALGIPFACLRAFNVYGPGEASHRLLPNLLKGFASGKKIPLSIGTQIRDFIQLDDVLDALLCVVPGLMERPQAGGIYNLCTGRGTSVADFARIAADIAGADPAKLDLGAVPLRPDDMMWQVGNNSRLRETFGWAAKLTVRDGLARAIAEMRQSHE